MSDSAQSSTSGKAPVDPTIARRIKVHTIVSLVSAGIALLSFGLFYLVFQPLGIGGGSESFGFGVFLLTQLPFAAIAFVMGLVAFFYKLRTPVWRGSRIVALLVGLGMFVVFVLPIVLGMLISVAPQPMP